MRDWDNWIHPREWGASFFADTSRLNTLYDLAETVAKDWYATEVRYFYNHHVKGQLDRKVRMEMKEFPPNEYEMDLMRTIVQNYLPNKDSKIPLGWLRQQFQLNIFSPSSGPTHIDRIIQGLHDTSYVIEASSIFDIKKTDKYEGDRDIEWIWTFVNTVNSDVDSAYELVLNRLEKLIKEQPLNEKLYKSYIDRLLNVKAKMADRVSENIEKHKKRLNNQHHLEGLSSNMNGFIFDYMEDDDKKTIRHFFLYAEHNKKPMYFKTKNAEYAILYLGETIVGKSAYKYEPVKERSFSVSIKSETKEIKGITLKLVPELVTGTSSIYEEPKPGHVFSSKVYHPKYKKVVGVKKGLFSGKYFLFLDYPKHRVNDSLVYKQPELFTTTDSDTTSKTLEALLKLIAKVHNRKKKVQK